MDEDPRIGKALELLAKAEANHAKTFDLLQEAKAILQSEPGVKSVVKRLFDCFHELWRRRYGSSYAFAGAKDGAMLKRLLKTMGGGDIARRMSEYLKDDDPFVVEAKHPLGLFVSRVNRYSQTSAQPGLDLAPTPSGCTHTPPCRNDVEHTRRAMQDLRRS